jgi:hypothetical protein
MPLSPYVCVCDTLNLQQQNNSINKNNAALEEVCAWLYPIFCAAAAAVVVVCVCLLSRDEMRLRERREIVHINTDDDGTDAYSD